MGVTIIDNFFYENGISEDRCQNQFTVDVFKTEIKIIHSFKSVSHEATYLKSTLLTIIKSI